MNQLDIEDLEAAQSLLMHLRQWTQDYPFYHVNSGDLWREGDLLARIETESGTSKYVLGFYQ